MAKYRIMVTDTLYPNIDYEREILSAIDAEVFLASATDEETLIHEGQDCDGLIVEFANVNARVIEGLTQCKIIVRTAIGYDNIDVKAASSKGIMAANVPDYCVEEVSEHALALVLACGRKVVAYNTLVKNNGWDTDAGRPIRRMNTQTLGLVGFGNIAQLLAKKASSLGMRIIAFDPFLTDEVFVNAGVERVANIKEIAAEADFLSLHIPFTPENKNIVNDELLKQMKSTSFLINTSRGGLVDIEALTRALLNNVIAGAALDVMPQEPPEKDCPLFALDNLIVTPHCGYYSDDADVELRRKSVEQVILALTEGKPKYLINA